MPNSQMLSTLNQQPTAEPSSLEALKSRYDSFISFSDLVDTRRSQYPGICEDADTHLRVTCIFGGVAFRHRTPVIVQLSKRAFGNEGLGIL